MHDQLIWTLESAATFKCLAMMRQVFIVEMAFQNLDRRSIELPAEAAREVD